MHLERWKVRKIAHGLTFVDSFQEIEYQLEN